MPIKLELKLNHYLLVGCDPELFVKKNGQPISAHGLIQGDKKNPLKVPGGAIQVDGMALEFNTHPAGKKYYFIEYINEVLRQLRERIPPDLEFDISPVAVFEKSHFDSQPECARELGCDPDYNAWTGEENPRPDNNTTMRTASGHVHIGFGQELNNSPAHIEACHAIVKELDVFLGIPSVIYDQDPRRRIMYGKAGAYRPKPYGVEYRVLSNAWLRSERLMGWVFDNASLAYEACKEGFTLHDVIGKDVIEEIINNSNKKLALKICQEYDIPVVRR